MMNATLEDLEKELWLRNRNSDGIKWKQKDGTEISIKDMSDEHLLNAINHLLNHEYQRSAELDALAGFPDF